MKSKCNNCHFFAKSILLKEDMLTNTVSEEDRNTIEKSKIKPALGKWEWFKCQKGVWDDSISPCDKFYENIMETDRNNCFFYPTQKNMMFAAADILQQREAENQAIKKSHKHTLIGLWIAAAAMATNAIIEGIKLCFGS